MPKIQYSTEQIEFLKKLAKEGTFDHKIFQDYAGAKESAKAIKEGANFFAVYDNLIQSLQHEASEFDVTDEEIQAEINKFFDYL